MLVNSLKIIVPAAAILLWLSIFTVDERQEAIKFQFGEIIGFDFEPGLNFKIPFINNVKKFDNRILTIDQRPERFLKALVLCFDFHSNHLQVRLVGYNLETL